MTTDNDQLGIHDIAKLAKLTVGAIWKQRDRGTMPKPDGHIARSPWWYRSTIEAWMKNRPKQGRPPKTTASNTTTR